MTVEDFRRAISQFEAGPALIPTPSAIVVTHIAALHRQAICDALVLLLSKFHAGQFRARYDAAKQEVPAVEVR
jgi:hypothetical protein